LDVVNGSKVAHVRLKLWEKGGLLEVRKGVKECFRVSTKTYTRSALPAKEGKRPGQGGGGGKKISNWWPEMKKK